MRFDIRLIHDIDSVFVAQRVPARVIRIMGCSHGIDIQFFHYADVTDHLLLGDDIASMSCHLVSVCTLDENRLAIDEKLTSAHLDSPESETD